MYSNSIEGRVCIDFEMKWMMTVSIFLKNETSIKFTMVASNEFHVIENILWIDNIPIKIFASVNVFLCIYRFA
jgi:hypothetical protein